LCNHLLLLVVVIIIEIIDVLLCLLDGLLTLGSELLGSLRVPGIPLLAPLLDDLRFELLLFLGVGCVARVVAD
jgi:hypothetical protein